MIRKSTLAIAFTTIALSAPAIAHIEYYDLNQAAHVTDLTAAGKTAATSQYGSTPADVMALNGPPRADGIGAAGLSSQQDLPLNNSSLWNSTYQTTTAVGTFSGITYTPSSSTATVDVTDVTDWAWADGTKTTLGDSHKVDFFNFRLTQASNVVITWNVDSGGTYLDCGFSLYSGVLPYQGHDDSVEILNPIKVGVGKVQDALDNGTYHDVQGILSVYRNTAPGAPTYIGQFNALNNWGQANPAGNWSTIAFSTAVNAKITALSSVAADTLESLTIYLQPGNYTIAASGALGAAGSGASFGLSNLHGHLTFTAAVATDTDGDGIADSLDNCTLVANPTQLDTNHDGYGNICDADLNNDGHVTAAGDYVRMRSVLGQPSTFSALAADSDMNGDGQVTAAGDYVRLRARLVTDLVGPSGLSCAGTVPCP